MKADKQKTKGKRKIPQTSTIWKSIDLAFLKCCLVHPVTHIPITVTVFLVQIAERKGSIAVDT